MKKRYFIILILLISALSFGILGFSLLVKGDNQTYTISSDYFSASNAESIKFFKYQDSLILASSYQSNANEYNTKITMFNPQSGNSSLLYSGNCIGIDVQGNNLFLAYNEKGVDEESNIISVLNVEKYDLSSDISLENPTEIKIQNAYLESFNAFAVDQNQKYLLLNNKNPSPKMIEKYSSDGNKNTDLECSFNLKSILKSSDNQIFANSLDNNAILLVDNLTEYQNLILPVNIIGTETLVDLNSNVYNLSDEFELLYSTATGNNIACSYDDNILIYCENTLLLLDKDSGCALSQFELNQSTDMILQNNGTISCFNFSELASGKITVEVVNSEPENLQYQKFIPNDDAFTTNPVSGTYISEELSKYDEWIVSFDKQKLLIGIRGTPHVKINFSGSETIISDNDLTINNDNSLTFPAPEYIDEGTYSVTIIDICTNTGKPAKCEYSLTVKNKTVTSSTSSSETTSSTSSTSSTSEETNPGNTRIESATYTIDRTNNTIKGIDAGTTLAQLKKNLTYSGTICSVKSNGSVIKSGKVGTGTKIHLMNSDTELDCLTVIINGDLTGEGNINSNDVQQGCNYLLGENNLDEFALLAFDLNNDGNVDTADLVLLNRIANNIKK